MKTENYIYIIQTFYRGFNHGFSFFKNHDEMSEYIYEHIPTLVEENELENETKYLYIVTRIAEDDSQKVTYSNIVSISNGGQISWHEETDEEWNHYTQPQFVYEAEDADYKQKYSEFYYNRKDGKFIDYIDEYDTLEEMSADYFSNQTL